MEPVRVNDEACARAGDGRQARLAVDVTELHGQPQSLKGRLLEELAVPSLWRRQHADYASDMRAHLERRRIHRSSSSMDENLRIAETPAQCSCQRITERCKLSWF